MKKRIKVKTRRRPPLKSQLEFTVVAKDSTVRQEIEQKAKEQKLKFFTKGSAANRLYFKCTEKNGRISTARSSSFASLMAR